MGKCKVQNAKCAMSNGTIDGLVRVAHDIGSDILNWYGTLAHATFLRRGERWLCDLFRDRKLVERLSGALLVYAPSAGEVASAVPILKSLAARHPDVPLVVLPSTASGLAAAKRTGFESLRLTSGGRGFYSRLVRELDPRGLVIVQVAHVAGMPINLISAMAERRRPVVVVNGYLPAQDMLAAKKRIPRLFRHVYGRIDAYSMQSQEDAARVVSLGAPAERVAVAGDVKFDAALMDLSADRAAALAAEMGIEDGEPLVVAGSTHSGEETALFEAFRAVTDEVPRARLVIAPRRLPRAQEVAALVGQLGFSAALRSSGARGAQVIVLDTMGELRPLYGAAWIAFVGGTLVPIGGHNVLEPAAWGRPVIFGPHTAHTRGSAEMLVDEGGAFRVSDGQELAHVMLDLLRDDDLRRKCGERALGAVRSRAGATALCARVVERLVFCGPEPAIPVTLPAAKLGADGSDTQI